MSLRRTVNSYSVRGVAELRSPAWGRRRSICRLLSNRTVLFPALDVLLPLPTPPQRRHTASAAAREGLAGAPCRLGCSKILEVEHLPSVKMKTRYDKI